MSTARKQKLSSPQLEAVARLFGALAESNRLALLQALRGGPLSVNELVVAVGMKQANVSRHLALLHAHRLVKRERQGTSIQYAIADPIIFPLCNLVCEKMARDNGAAAALFHPEI